VSIENEARAEAEKRWPENEWAYGASGLGPEQMKSARRTGFVAGAEWQASRKPEAAPSDTDDELARWLHMRFGENQSKNWNQLSQRLRIAWRDMAGDAPSRTSQPVQVELTDEMVEKAARAIFAAMRTSHPLSIMADYDDPAYEYTKNACKRDARAALEAALGGGDHAE